MIEKTSEAYPAFYLRWMHRTRWHKGGKLDIKRTPLYTSEKAARRAFREYSQSDYACALIKTTARPTTAGLLLSPGETLEENAVWKRRMREQKKKRLKAEIERLEKQLEAKKVEYEEFIRG